MAQFIESVKFGREVHVDAAVKLFGAQLNKPNNCDVYPLHVAVWRNHLPIIERLLAAGASTACVDGESGWTPLHRALYLGHLAAAAKLLQAGAAVEALDNQERTPVDLLASELRRMPAEGTGRCSAVWSWGSGANYQLGTGSTDFHLTPLRVEALQGLGVVAVVAAKFHSAALTSDGRLLTWGWGRGGRLGHPDYNIHSGESALIQPWQVAGLGRRPVASVAAGKHHMLCATHAGDLWSWGGNRDGKLGYPNVDTQPTPRKLDFRGRAVLVAASNRHSACLTSAGEVWTWGANNDGQLGYGTNNSANNPTPRLVEAMKGKALVALSLSKRHSVVLTADGDAYTWGHRVVTPRRVPLAGSRDTARLAALATPPPPAAGGGGSAAAAAAPQASPAASAAAEVRFHRNHGEVVRPEAALVAAGYVHTTVVTRSGAVLCWRSADPALRPVEVAGPLAGKRVVGVSASKTRTVVCTDVGQVYMWESKEGKERAAGRGDEGPGPAAVAAAAASEPLVIAPTRVPGLTRVAQVAVGEKHTLALQAWTLPPMPDAHGVMPELRRQRRRHSDGSESSGSDDGDDAGGGGSAGRGGGGWWHAHSGSLRGTPGVQSRMDTGMMAQLPSGTSPLGSSPLARSLGAGAGLSPSPATPSAAAAGGLAALFARRRGHGPAAGELAEPQGPGWSLFSHRPAADDGGTAGHRRSSGGGGPGDADDMFGLGFGDCGRGGRRCSSDDDGGGGGGGSGGTAVPPLQVLCQLAVATRLVEPRTALPLLEYADVAGAALLRCYCLAVAVANLDCALLEAPAGLTTLPPHLLAELEHLYRAALLAPPPSAAPPAAADAAAAAAAGVAPGSSPAAASPFLLGSAGASASGGGGGGADALEAFHRRRVLLSRLQPGRRPTAAPAWLEGAAAAERMAPQASSRVAAAAAAALGAIGHAGPPGQAPQQALAPPLMDAVQGGGAAAAEAEGEAQRLARNLQRKLAQIGDLEELQRGGRQLDAQQHAKMSQRGALQEALQALAAGASVEAVRQAIAHSAEVASKLAARPDAASAAPAAAATVVATAATAGCSRAGGAASGRATGTGAAAGGVADAGSAAASGTQAGPPPQQQQQARQARGSGSGGDKKRGARDAAATADPAGPSVSVSAVASDSAAPVASASAAAIPLPSDRSPALAQLGSSSAATPGGGTSAVASAKKQQRRGGLSMFLAGALDQPASPPPPPQPAASPAAPKAPAWGGLKPVATPPSAGGLRELLSTLTPAAAQQPAQGPQSAAALPPPQQAPGSASASQLPSRSPSGNLSSAAQVVPARTPSGPLPLPLPLAQPAAGASALAFGGFPIAAAAGGARKQTAPSAGTGTGARPTGSSAAPTGSAAAAQPGLGAVTGSAAGGGGSTVKLSLAEFMAGRVATAPLQAQRAREAEREPAGPAWGGVLGTSPPGAKSLLDIQAEQAQVQKRAAASWARSAAAGAATAAAAAAAAGSGLGAPLAAHSAADAAAAAPVGSSPPAGRSLLAAPAQAPSQQPSKWYVPEECQPAVAAKPLTAIQIEERAIKELSARYRGRVVARVVNTGGSTDAGTAGQAAGHGGGGGPAPASPAAADAAVASASGGAGSAPRGAPAGGTGRSKHRRGKGQGQT